MSTSLRRQAWSRSPQPLLSQRCAPQVGGRRQRCGAALARRPLVWAAPVSCALCYWALHVALKCQRI
ncbi:hypothetical protein C6571_16060 [Simplicispira suum]|uniref:Uncharacterized protein n=1 Tax=Simplicispira suum TaxID=2109915 RepID=A0A2S0N3L0_9BURK|nr:hypothetical protein C6571_16060 [Simplicispira suum]